MENYSSLVTYLNKYINNINNNNLYLDNTYQCALQLNGSESYHIGISSLVMD